MDTIVASAVFAPGASAAPHLSLGEALDAKLGGRQPAMIVAFSSIRHPLAPTLAGLAARYPSAVVLGSSTAGEFTESATQKGGVVAFALAGDFKIFGGYAHGLSSDVEGAVSSAIEGLPTELDGYPHTTAIVLLDPLSGVGEEASLLLSAALGDDVALVGGAAGDDVTMTRTEVGFGASAGSDALAVAIVHSKTPLGIGIAHGHAPLVGAKSAHAVTKAVGNVVEQLDGRPAWDVWHEETRERARELGIVSDDMTAEQQGAYLLRFEGGLETGSAGEARFKVRAPLARRADGALTFACGVPEGSMLHITESTPEGQIDSARRAAALARRGLGGRKVAGALVFDCICRNLILGEQFQQAVAAISDELGAAPLAGFETYGEIGLQSGALSGFHNTTSVVVAFGADAG